MLRLAELIKRSIRNPELNSQQKIAVIQKTIAEHAANPEAEQATIFMLGGRCGWTPFGEAVSLGDIQLVQWLSEQKGVNPHADCNEFGHSALFIAAGAGHLALVKFFLTRGLSINQISTRGCDDSFNGETPRHRTPLHEAVRGGHTLVVDLLLAHGADRAIEDQRGHTPLDLAEILVSVPEQAYIKTELFGNKQVNFSNIQEIIFALKAGGLRKYYAQALSPAFSNKYKSTGPSPLRALASNSVRQEDCWRTTLDCLGTPPQKKKIIPAQASLATASATSASVASTSAPVLFNASAVNAATESSNVIPNETLGAITASAASQTSPPAKQSPPKNK